MVTLNDITEDPYGGPYACSTHCLHAVHMHAAHATLSVKGHAYYSGQKCMRRGARTKFDKV